MQSLVRIKCHQVNWSKVVRRRRDLRVNSQTHCITFLQIDNTSLSLHHVNSLKPEGYSYHVFVDNNDKKQ